MQKTSDHFYQQDGISRRHFIKAGISSLGAAALGMGCDNVGFAKRTDGRPNILLIITDDQRGDAMGCSGNSIIQTPHMDRLAENGTRFKNAFVTSPICAASRASILTGLHERAHGYTFGEEALGRKLTDRCYPNLLRRAGYHTGFVGKLGVDIEEDNIAHMFNFFKPLDRNPYVKRIHGAPRHLTEITGEETMKFLRGLREDTPFSLTVSFNAPHAEDEDPNQYYWPPACDDLYRDVHIPDAVLSDPAFFNALPDFMKNSLNRIRWEWRFNEPDKYQKMVKGYYRMISGVDLEIGKLIHELKVLGLFEDTIIIFTGDNGYFLGERGFAGKWLLHEPSIRVPLIIFDPQKARKKRGRVFTQPAVNIDIAPTILAMAGVPAPERMQGMSLLPILNNESTQWRREIFCEHLYNHPGIPKSEGIRTPRWKYIRYPDHPAYKELYDLQNDVLEARNLAKDQQYRHQFLALDEKCDRLAKKFQWG